MPNIEVEKRYINIISRPKNHYRYLKTRAYYTGERNNGFVLLGNRSRGKGVGGILSFLPLIILYKVVVSIPRHLYLK